MFSASNLFCPYQERGTVGCDSSISGSFASPYTADVEAKIILPLKVFNKLNVPLTFISNASSLLSSHSLIP